MYHSRNQLKLVWRIAVAGVIVCLTHTAKAGWTGVMNGTGLGWASVNVTASTGQTNALRTPNMTGPSAAMTNTPTYFSGAPLPAGASPATIARIKGSAGYVWKASTVGSNGDKTDNAALDKLIKLPGADCANLEMDSTSTIAPDGKSGILVVNTKATAGTAILLRGYEYTGPLPETVEELETNEDSSLKWYVLMVGPFDLNSSNCNALIIPFTVETSITNLYFVSDGEAKSLPLEITCPPNIVVTCGQPVVYQSVIYSGCGDVTVDYVPPADYPFPRGVTPVTVTLKDSFGNSTNCTFTVTVMDTTPPVVPVLPAVSGQCSASVTTPTTVDICGTTTNVITATTADPTSYNAQGSYTVHWSFDDGNGNVSTAAQSVTVKDTVPPVKPTLADINYSYCTAASITPPTPTTTDNCAGAITGTTTTSFPITAVGTNVVTWKFDDGNGNVTTATQNVIVSGLSFAGFYSPIAGANGSCTQPVQNIKAGSVEPIKFDIQCGSTVITGGTPPVVLIQAYSNCTPGANLVNVNATYQNNWHYNWDTSGWAKGIYKVIVVLPDGTSRFVFLKLQ